jgi:hypothetical protein
MIALTRASLLRADTVDVRFAGTIVASSIPGVGLGDSFSGGFSYSTEDPFIGTSAGLNSFNLGSDVDTFFLSVDGSILSLGKPLSGLTASVGNAPVSFDPDPTQDYFQISSNANSGTVATTFSLPGFQFNGFSIQLVGDAGFIPSGALPDPFDASKVIFGSDAILSAVVFDFADTNGQDDFAVGQLDQTSSVPEPRGLALTVLAILLLVGLFARRAAYSLSIFRAARRFATPAV